MSFSYSRFGNKYLKSEIEKTDEIYHEELKKMYSKVKCADCSNEYASWATLKRGLFICMNCAQILRADSSNKIKSCMGSYFWHRDEIEVMRENNKC